MYSSYHGEVEAQVLPSFPYFCGCVSESYVFLPQLHCNAFFLTNMRFSWNICIFKSNALGCEDIVQSQRAI